MRATDYQPIKFLGEDQGACCDVPEVGQKVFFNDVVNAQIQYGSCPDAEEELASPDFDPSAPWTLRNESGNAFSFFGNNFADLIRDGWSVEANLGLTEGDWCEIRVRCVFPPEVFGAQTIFKIIPNIIKIEGFDVPLQFFAATDEFVFYARFGTGSTIKLVREDVSLNQSSVINVVPTRITMVSVKQLDNPDVTVVDLDGNVLDGTLSPSIVVDRQPPFINIAYNPSPDALDAGFFQLRVRQRCDEDIVLLSEPIKIIDDTSCFLRVTGCGTNTTFAASFQPIARVGGIIVDDGPMHEREIHRTSRGVHSLAYGHFQQTFKMLIERIPEHIRKFFYSLGNMETIAVQVGTGQIHEYFVVEEPEKMPFDDGDQVNAAVELRVVRKRELNEAVFTGVCSPSLPPFVLGEKSTNTIISEKSTDTLISGQ